MISSTQENNVNKHYDVLISGAGTVGLLVAYAIQKIGFSVLLIDSTDLSNHKNDIRNIAITHHSKTFFEKIGLWSSLEKYSTKIEHIVTTENGSPVLLNFSTTDIEDIDNNIVALGFLVKNKNIYNTIIKNIEHHEYNITILKNTYIKTSNEDGKNVIVKLNNDDVITVKKLIFSEGRFSETINKYGIQTFRKNYKQYTMICDLESESRHNNIAYEIFFQTGAMAFLPCIKDNVFSLAWTSDLDEIKITKALSKERFIEYISEKSGMKFSKLLTKRVDYPLSLSFVLKYHINNIGFIGDMIHGINPIAGQGMNLAIYDIESLVKHVSNLGISNSNIFHMMQKERLKNNLAMIVFTDSIIKLFSSKKKFVKIVRNIGLSAVENIDYVKRLFIKYAIGKNIK